MPTADSSRVRPPAKRIDAVCVDKLGGRMDTNFFDRKPAEWREERRKFLVLISEHQDANQTYLD